MNDYRRVPNAGERREARLANREAEYQRNREAWRLAWRIAWAQFLVFCVVVPLLGGFIWFMTLAMAVEYGGR